MIPHRSNLIEELLHLLVRQSIDELFKLVELRGSCSFFFLTSHDFRRKSHKVVMESPGSFCAMIHDGKKVSLVTYRQTFPMNGHDNTQCIHLLFLSSKAIPKYSGNSLPYLMEPKKQQPQQIHSNGSEVCLFCDRASDR